MRIIFVGLHNKPGKIALCSSTKSGKLIDRIIKNFGTECVKTNLYDVDYFPVDKAEQFNLAMDWWERVNPNEEDVIVLLGNATHKGFKCPFLPQFRPTVIKIAHPASKFSHDAMNEYVNSAVELILNK
jgi:hypothetical protein